MAEMESAATGQLLPVRADFQARVVALAAEWDAYDYAQRNRVLRWLVRRVVLTRTDTGVTIDVHPLWEADQWGASASTHV
jgi:hypothetical protein